MDLVRTCHSFRIDDELTCSRPCRFSIASLF